MKIKHFLPVASFVLTSLIGSPRRALADRCDFPVEIVFSCPQLQLICRTLPSPYLFSVRVFASSNGLLQSLHTLRPSAKNPNSTTLLPSSHDITAEEASAVVSRSSLSPSESIQNFLQKREAEFLLFCFLTKMNFPFFCRPEIFSPAVFDAMFTFGTSQS